MSFHYLQSLFNPQSIAVVGASSRPHRIGNVVMRNLLAAGFGGAIMPVNPRRDAVSGVLTYPDIASLPRTPDLAILCTPAATLPELIAQCGLRGTRAAIVMSGHLATTQDKDGRPLAETVVEVARRHGIRLLGGSTLGVLVPRLGLNATFSHVQVEKGNLGFVSQSDAVGTLVLDWARPKQLGFSHFVSLGDALDIGFGEVLDFLASDPDTHAILLFIESIRDRRSFMAAARAAARNKPVVAIKAGRAPHNYPSGITADDKVYDAVLRRAGILRVDHLDELFGAVETVVKARPISGNRLVAISNGGGAGTMVEDTLYLGGYQMPELAPACVERLRRILPRHWDGRNPIDVRVDGSPSRYADVFRVLVEEQAADAILAMHSPNALTDGAEIAQVLIDTVRNVGGNLLTCWIGDASVTEDRKRFAAAGIPSFDTPGHAAKAFLHLSRHRIAREILMQVPADISSDFVPDLEAARRIVTTAEHTGQFLLEPDSVIALLVAYGIPTCHEGPNCGQVRQLRVALINHPIFGPLLVLGEGGRDIVALADVVVGLPPLNLPLARDLITRSSMALQIGEHTDALALTLTKISQLIVDLPEITSFEIDPLCADAVCVTAISARIGLDFAPPPPHRLAIHPYPRGLEETATLKDGRPVLLRPIRPEDEAAHYLFLSKLSKQDIVYRFFHYVEQIPRRDMARLTQIDYDREMAFIASATDTEGRPETLGVVRIVADPDHHACEFAIIIRSDLKGLGLGSMLMKKIIAYARGRGIRQFVGDVMAENQPMITLLKRMGFRTGRADEPGILRATLDLQPEAVG